MLLIVAAAVGGALFLFLPIRAVNLATGDAGWSTTGCFAPNSVYPTTHFDSQITAHERQGVTLRGSYCGNDASTGELRSPVFPAPTILELFVGGYAGKEGLLLFLERESDHVRMPLPVVRHPAETWMKQRWWTQQDFRGQMVRLVAVDNATGVGGWLAVSNPRRFSVLSYFRVQLKTFAQTMGTYLFQLALFLLPGFAVASQVTARRRRTISPIYSVIVVITVGAMLGYISFWAFFFSKGLGRFFTYAVYLSAAGLLIVPRFSPREALRTTAKMIAQPFLYATLAGLCYMSFYFIYSDPFAPGIGYAADRFFAALLPGDNVITAIFADRIYDRQSVIPFCCGDWLSSDRPPLQSGVVVMERPLALLHNRELTYELLSSALQCFWICGVWCLMTSIGTDRARFRQVIGFLIFSGFLFYNSVYTWPKLLSAAAILFLLSILFERIRAKSAFGYFEIALAALCLGMALMAHPGSTFSLPVFGLLFLRFRHLFSLRQAGLALLIVITIYLPWSLYQKYVDPPGNRLLKMHLGGSHAVDSRTTWEAIRDSYHTHSLSEVIRYKWSNIVFLGGHKFFDSYGLTDFPGFQKDLPARQQSREAREESRTAQRFYMWNAVGLVNLGWVAGLLLLLNRRWRGGGLALPQAGWLIVVALANMVFWSVVTFGPDETQTAHSSYADILLLSVGLLSFILTLPRIFFLLCLAWQLFNFFAVWVLSLPGRLAQPITLEWPMIVFGVMLAALLVWLTVKPEPKAA